MDGAALAETVSRFRRVRRGVGGGVPAAEVKGAALHRWVLFFTEPFAPPVLLR
ncbi:hypothetical protein MK280_20005 [Myxococcota bacterium]|nr:hypothetical protein [Myxococcota bacterium]